ncbi:MAG: DUF6270 domain-containing protein [Solirubrobacteraceae bacterium]
MRVGIFGSCVTRDLFEDAAVRPALARYASRSSLISAVAAPVALDAERVQLDSAFQRRCVIEDFEKSFLGGLERDLLDWLVVDLIDERFDVLRTPASYVTCSSAYSRAGLEDDHGFARVRRLTGEAAALIERAAQAFAERLTAVLPAERVIIHRAHWMTRYRDGEELHAFPADRVDFAEHHNAALDHAYDVLERGLGGRAATIALDRGRQFADARHRWGLEPYHYDANYNAAALGRLRALVNR